MPNASTLIQIHQHNADEQNLIKIIEDVDKRMVDTKELATNDAFIHKFQKLRAKYQILVVQLNINILYDNI